MCEFLEIRYDDRGWLGEVFDVLTFRIFFAQWTKIEIFLKIKNFNFFQKYKTIIYYNEEYNGNTSVNIKFIWFLTRFYSNYLLMTSPEYNQNNFFWLLFYLSNKRVRIYCGFNIPFRYEIPIFCTWKIKFGMLKPNTAHKGCLFG